MEQMEDESVTPIRKGYSSSSKISIHSRFSMENPDEIPTAQDTTQAEKCSSSSKSISTCPVSNVTMKGSSQTTLPNIAMKASSEIPMTWN